MLTDSGKIGWLPTSTIQYSVTYIYTNNTIFSGWNNSASAIHRMTVGWQWRNVAHLLDSRTGCARRSLAPRRRSGTTGNPASATQHRLNSACELWFYEVPIVHVQHLQKAAEICSFWIEWTRVVQHIHRNVAPQLRTTETCVVPLTCELSWWYSGAGSNIQIFRP